MSKQEVFFRCKKPGRPLASLFSPLPVGLVLTFLLPCQQILLALT